MGNDLKEHTRGDWWDGITIPQILVKGPEDTVYTPKDLTGCIVTMQVRSRANSSTALLDFRSDNPTPEITVTEPYGPIIVSGCIIDLAAGTYVWDLEIYFPGGKPKTYPGGNWPIKQDVTRRTY